VLVTAIAGLIVSIQSISETRAQQSLLETAVECQNRYNEVNNERTRRITDVTTLERNAEAEADTALFNFTLALAQGKSEEERVKLFSIMTEKLSAQEKIRAQGTREREQNPVPPPPEAFCGGQTSPKPRPSS
jgi:hypothetical protein